MYRLMDGIEFLKSLPDHSVDGIFTDPPWRKRTTRWGKFQLAGADHWLELIRNMTDEAARILRPDGRCLLWLTLIVVGDVCKIIRSLEYRFMVFVRYIPPKYIAAFEVYFDPILYFAPPGAPWPGKTFRGYNKPGEYVQISGDLKDTSHPCPRPTRKVQNILKDWFYPGEYVIDPFAGSDTTGRAARELGLKWDSCEIDPKMYETGIERHRQGILFENEV